MNELNNLANQWSRWLGNPLGVYRDSMEYFTDAYQRAVIYADIERQVGDQYQVQTNLDAPNVLNFPAELVLAGNTLDRPVNYSIFRILPAKGQKIDPTKRPFIVVDPRAGHGPGIGGFKPESEIGAALQAGHPCYFVGFLPIPVPGQTVEDVMRAHAEFLRVVADLHPESPGKPVTIGNCQAGWHILMAAAVWPDLFGPIIVAGAPVSYWAGDNPMRYAGGLLGGSWMTALAGDLGNGLFDGASLVQNFENLDPANTLWSKKYNVYANVDTEADRYIGFEKYWGGYVLLNDIEMQYIVDNLFIGNKLSTAELITSDGIRIDLRNIKSTILVFCSYGDNITPPAQALGWITDLYNDEDSVRSHNQTIIYSTHESIGHLGIFVSGSVGKKEHRKFVNVIEQMDLLPAGIYRATVDKTPEDNGFVNDPYLLSIQQSSLRELNEIIKPDVASDRQFAAAAKVSEINLTLYRTYMQPWVRMFSTPQTADILRKLHPMRMEYEVWTSNNPLAKATSVLAESMRANRQSLDEDNPLLLWESLIAKNIDSTLDMYRDARDGLYAAWFRMFYGSPFMQALIAQAPGDTTPVRTYPGITPEHFAFVNERIKCLAGKLHKGSVYEAAVRSLLYIFMQHPAVDERYHHVLVELEKQEGFKKMPPDELRETIREQALIIYYHGDESIDAIADLLRDQDPKNVQIAVDAITAIIQAGGEDKASPDVDKALKYIQKVFAAGIKLNQPEEQVQPKKQIQAQKQTQAKKETKPKKQTESKKKAEPKKQTPPKKAK